MKISLSFAVLAFPMLSCEKKEKSPPAEMPDPMEVTDNTSAAPMSSDTISPADNSSRPGRTEYSDTARTVR